MTSRRGYLYALIVLAAGLGTLALMILRMKGQVDDLTRIAVPGTSELSLPAGESIGYGEPSPDAIGDVSFSARCNAVAADGSKVELGTPTAKVTYALGSHQGVSILSINAEHAGKVTLTCTATEPFILAVGGGVGTSILIGVLAGVGGFFGALTIAVLTWVKRRGDKRRAQAFPAEMQ